MLPKGSEIKNWNGVGKTMEKQKDIKSWRKRTYTKDKIEQGGAGKTAQGTKHRPHLQVSWLATKHGGSGL